MLTICRYAGLLGIVACIVGAIVGRVFPPKGDRIGAGKIVVASGQLLAFTAVLLALAIEYLDRETALTIAAALILLGYIAMFASLLLGIFVRKRTDLSAKIGIPLMHTGYAIVIIGFCVGQGIKHLR
jgi:hypothetical protein